jgi:hypothetical protein
MKAEVITDKRIVSTLDFIVEDFLGETIQEEKDIIQSEFFESELRDELLFICLRFSERNRNEDKMAYFLEKLSENMDDDGNVKQLQMYARERDRQSHPDNQRYDEYNLPF